jgi:hypothetical protein
MKEMCDQSLPQMGSLQMRSVGLHSTSGREKEGKKERVGKAFVMVDRSSSRPIR